MKVIKIKLKTLSPVHIGSGESFTPDSFVIDQESKALLHFNPILFYEKINPKQWEELKKISEMKSISALVALYRFYNRNLDKIKAFSHKAYPVPQELVETYQRVLSLKSEKDIYQSFNNMEINRTCVEFHSNQPFIPGSSVKGSLRTGYLEKLLKEKFSKEKDIHTLVDKYMKKPLDFEAYILNILNEKEKLKLENDPFRFFKISDLRPENEVSTKILYQVNLKKTTFKRARGVSLPIEVIPEGSIFYGEIKIDTPADPQNYPTFDLNKLLKGVKDHYREVLKEELELCKKYSLKNPVLYIQQFELTAYKNDKALLIKIGKHSGAEAVTLEGIRKIKIKTGKNSWQIASQPTTFWVASKKKKDVNGAQHFGWVYLEFLDIHEL
ncbi:MAG TPA: type III-A CRISPR-associated RAMP protein Csm5 [Candidatus Desulfofervidus auxilii]|uniref:CRISPR system Cms protein Csm5 n=2 Tax=Thermodesulfobacteriota TaxID=200940 RepID=A0A7C0Y291_DESA2|nr:CRISPR-Cas system type III CSM-effector complex subunit Csm5 [Candidatus Thermodesulfobacterium syntrophicum]RLG10103.1 MAG: type III-A CRISPR-associated RAMP protein Csm5 [Candidatus Pacearchaeota archaeon]HDD43806.1 type III-A CRISPR-associated RAMP protein Csm5 [Candidatus Desulfofervidus auxilii]